MGVRQRVAYARELVAEGHSPSALARILQVSRESIYRIPTRPPVTVSRSRPPVDEVERAIVEVAEANPTDGYHESVGWELSSTEPGEFHAVTGTLSAQPIGSG